MAYFEWADDLAIDAGGPIDQDHRHLVDMVNALHTATSEGRGREVVGPILEELIAYTDAHLRREEQEMARVRFPTLEEHLRWHRKFIADLNDLRRRYEAGSVTVAAQLSMVLRDWLSLHIRRSDRELREFLRQP